MKKIIILLLSSLVLSGIIVGYFIYDKQHPAADKSYGYVDKSPPTDGEKQDSERHKDSPSKPSTSTDPLVRMKANVEITTWKQTLDSVDVNGFVSNIIDEGGTCTLTLTSMDEPGDRVTKSRPSEVNANNTTCGVTSVALSKLGVGKWSAVLSYESPRAYGSSNSEVLEIN